MVDYEYRVMGRHHLLTDYGTCREQQHEIIHEYMPCHTERRRLSWLEAFTTFPPFERL